MGRRRQSVGNVIRKNKCHFFGSCPNGSVAARIFEGCFKDHCWSGTTYPTPIQFSWRLVFNAAVDDCSSKRIAYLTIFFLERIFLFFDCFCRRRCGTSVLGNDDDDVGVVRGCLHLLPCCLPARSSFRLAQNQWCGLASVDACESLQKIVLRNISTWEFLGQLVAMTS